MTQKSDHELMTAYLSGDEAAFAILYERYSGKVYAFLKKKLQNRQEVDEVFQAALLKFHNTRKNYDPKYPILQWLYVVTKTTLLDHIRKQSREVSVDETPIHEMNSINVSQNETQSALVEKKDMEVLRSLTPEQRQAVEMRVIDEFSYEQIAKKLNRSEANIRQMISRALKKLRGTSELATPRRMK